MISFEFSLYRSTHQKQALEYLVSF